jgi:hypothetical protein
MTPLGPRLRVVGRLRSGLLEPVRPDSARVREGGAVELQPRGVVKRAAFSLMASLAVHDKDADDEAFVAFLPLIVAGSSDERNFVKKSVNWALRQIGKRDRRLNASAIATAVEIRAIDSRAARWIAADSLRELRSEAVQARLVGSARTRTTR